MARGIKTSELAEKRTGELAGAEAYLPVAVTEGALRGNYKVPLAEIAEIEAGARNISLTESASSPGKLGFTDYEGNYSEVQGGFTMGSADGTVAVGAPVDGHVDFSIAPAVTALSNALGGEATARGGADAELQSQIDALQGAVIFIGTINLATSAVTRAALNQRAADLGKSPPQKGYCLVDNDANDWWYDGSQWVNIGYYEVSQATNSNLGVVKGSTANLKVSVDGSGEMSVTGLDSSLGNLQTAINAEAAARAGADASLQNQINANVSNVQSDWNAASGLAQILNKPPIPTSLPPSGTAGGDLSGTYPNPTVPGLANKVSKAGDTMTGNLMLGSGTGAQANSINLYVGGNIYANSTPTGTAPTWTMVVENDDISWRGRIRPTGASSNSAGFLKVDTAGNTSVDTAAIPSGVGQKANLASTASDNSITASTIGVTGVLPIANGGTGVDQKYKFYEQFFPVEYTDDYHSERVLCTGAGGGMMTFDVLKRRLNKGFPLIEANTYSNPVAGAPRSIRVKFNAGTGAQSLYISSIGYVEGEPLYIYVYGKTGGTLSIYSRDNNSSQLSYALTANSSSFQLIKVEMGMNGSSFFEILGHSILNK